MRNTNYNRNNTPTNQLRLIIPRNMDFYNEMRNRPLVVTPQKRIFRAIQNPNGWWVYSNERCYAEVGSKLISQKGNITITADLDNLEQLRGDSDFKLVTERFISDKLIKGTGDKTIEHNKEFLGLDWVDDHQYEAVVFLEHI